MRNFLIVSSLFLTFLCAKGQTVYTVNTVPHPKVSRNSYVSDPQKVLSASTVHQINTELTALEALTTDQVAVVVVPSIGDEVPKDFAVDLFARLGIGQQEKDNGLLIFMVMDQRRVEFETGYGLEAVLPDVVCKRIQMNYMVPRFKEKNYDQGLRDGVTAVVQTLTSPEFRQQISEEEDEEEEHMSVVDIGRTIVWVMSILYGMFIFIVFFVKRNQGSFAERYPHVNKNKQKKVVLTIPTWVWLCLYFFFPLFFAVYMYQYEGPYYLWILAGGVYVLILISLVERKSRCTKAYKASFTKGDYYAQYNSHVKYFDGWGLAAIFFPIPFLFTDWKNKQRLQAIRKHERQCTQCQTPMVLLDEKSDDQHLKDHQILEEQIKSVDYDVWACPSCHAYQALAYYTKGSKYSACSHCGTKAYYMKSDEVKVAATYDHAGSGEKHYQCMYCKREQTDTYTIPRLTRSSSSSSGGGSSGGSFGGGSSGGGGSGSSW